LEGEMKKIDEPRTMAQAQNAVEELWPGKPYTVWIEDAGRTRHVSVRFGKGTNRVIVEGVGCTWTEAFESVEKCRKSCQRKGG
jgi:hypothetical protein